MLTKAGVLQYLLGSEVRGDVSHVLWHYLWLEAGTNFGVLADTQPGQPQLFADKHLVRLLEDAGISWRAYAEPDFGSPVFDNCPLDSNFLDVEHLAFVYFSDVNDGLNSQSADCVKHIRPYSQPATDLADHTSARYNFIAPNLCHDGNEDVCPCDATEPAGNTLRSDTWLKQNMPLILESDEYKQGGALFIIWDEAEDDGMAQLVCSYFRLLPKGAGKGRTAIPFTIALTLKTLQEIFGVEPLLGSAADSATRDLGDLFRRGGSNGR